MHSHAPRPVPALSTRIVRAGAPATVGAEVCAPSNQYLDLNPFGGAACLTACLFCWPLSLFVPFVPSFKNSVVYKDGINTGLSCGP
jgi:hypothetical protein